VPGGVGEAADLYKPVINETVNEETGQVVRSFMPNMAGSCAAGIQGSGGTGAFSNPLVNSVFTQGYYPGHSGIDLAAPVGTPVLASDAGVVIFSGWVSTSWGYGVLVVLDHGNGWTSYYAHLNATTVRCGQFVNRGGQVGTVGSTGNSSGPHLHFELRFNHVPDNPAGYIPVQ
jgi:murein DD-endopeptidase MepM/ murein hydrolase activator NlpD